jgi:hypothetical protein
LSLTGDWQMEELLHELAQIDQRHRQELEEAEERHRTAAHAEKCMALIRALKAGDLPLEAITVTEDGWRLGKPIQDKDLAIRLAVSDEQRKQLRESGF